MSDLTNLKALSDRATPGEWSAYSEPEVGMPATLFTGTVGTSDFHPVEPLTSVDVAFIAAAANHARELNKAAIAVLIERQRQISAEGWSTGHDDHHVRGELGLAAALYALPYESGMLEQDDFIRLDMLLEIGFDWKLKPETDRRKRLVKAAALILAEIERLDRAEVKDA